jgi:threonine aldolase
MASRGFASDNQSGAHPEVLAAVAAANEGHVPAYGDDTYTARAREVLRGHLGPDAEVFFVFNGTGANVTGLAQLLEPWQAVVCAATAHIATDECGAPERFTGSKLVTVAAPDGQLTPDLVGPHLVGFGFEHHVQPAVLSITQVSELGTVYSIPRIEALSALAREHGMLLHMDGARLANAAVALGSPFAAFTTDAGVDVLSFGGTKNGMLGGEAVCFLGPRAAELAEGFRYTRKQGTQLPSKCRFIAAQFAAMYEGDLWRRCAGNANHMADVLARAAAAAGVTITQPVEANEVFALLPSKVVPPLQDAYPFYVWDEAAGAHDECEVRWVTSWDTRREDVDRFAGLLADLAGG